MTQRATTAGTGHGGWPTPVTRAGCAADAPLLDAWLRFTAQAQA